MNIGVYFGERAEPSRCSQGQSGRTRRPRPPCLLFGRTLDSDKCIVCTIANHTTVVQKETLVWLIEQKTQPPERARRNVDSGWAIVTLTWYYPSVEYPFPPVGIVGAADGKNRRAFLYPPSSFS